MTTGTGRIVLYGQLDGPAEITPLDLMLRALTLIGCGSSPAAYKRAERPAGGWLGRVDRARDEILQRLTIGELHPLIDCVLPLEEIVKAHERVESGAAAGKVILVTTPVRG